MKNTTSSINKKIIARYLLDDENNSKNKKPDINVLLNRVKLDQKIESKKKIIFTAVTSLSVVLFSFLIF
jgi:hypothetical protein